MFDGLESRQFAEPITFGEPGDGLSLPARINRAYVRAKSDPEGTREAFLENFRASEARTRLVDNVWAQDRALEEAYDRRISQIKSATGVTLENPQRGGYSLSERDLRRLTREQGGPIDPSAYRAQRFDQELSTLREKHPDQAEALTFPDLQSEAKDIASAAETRAERAAQSDKANPVGTFLAGLAGGTWAGRRDPLFVGSLFGGPTSAVGKTALSRIVTSGIFQGLYNAGLTALEQPAVQSWRRELGLRSGVEPAIENVGLAFLFGAIPGAAIRGGQEALPRAALERVLRGAAEPGDAEAVVKAVGGGMTDLERGAVRAGEDSLVADRATGIPQPKDVPPDLHDDMVAAALKRADDPAAPSPEAVQAVNSPDLQDRIAAVQPRDLHEARVAADEALDDIGRAQGMDVQRRQIDEVKADYRLDTFEHGAAKGDPMGMVPYMSADGKPTLITEKSAAAVGQRETRMAALIRECK